MDEFTRINEHYGDKFTMLAPDYQGKIDPTKTDGMTLLYELEPLQVLERLELAVELCARLEGWDNGWRHCPHPDHMVPALLAFAKDCVNQLDQWDGRDDWKSGRIVFNASRYVTMLDDTVAVFRQRGTHGLQLHVNKMDDGDRRELWRTAEFHRHALSGDDAPLKRWFLNTLVTLAYRGDEQEDDKLTVDADTYWKTDGEFTQMVLTLGREQTYREWFEPLLDIWSYNLDTGQSRLPVSTMVALAVGVNHTASMRDALIYSLVTGMDRNQLLYVAVKPRAEQTKILVDRMIPEAYADTAPQDGQRMSVGMRMLKTLTQVRPDMAQPWATLAYVEWWHGDRNALNHVTKALELDPDCNLASIIASAILRGKYPASTALERAQRPSDKA